jgi:hypothetical protein
VELRRRLGAARGQEDEGETVLGKTMEKGATGVDDEKSVEPVNIFLWNCSTLLYFN